MNVTIREMVTEDAEAIARIEEECFSSPWSVNGILDTYNAGQSLFIVAIEDNSLAGYVGMTYAVDEAEIINIAVSSEYRKKGIAQMLLSTLQKKAAELGVNTIFLDVRISNEPAISLYKKLGYELCGTRKNFYTLPTEHAYIFRRDL